MYLIFLKLRFFLFLAFFILSSPSISLAQVEVNHQIENIVTNIKSDTGIEVLYKDLPDLHKANLSFTFAASKDYPVLLQFMMLLKDELLLYPKSFWLKFSNPRIILVKKHFFHEKPADGLFTTRGDVILLDFSRTRRNALAQRHSIHHEIFHQIDYHMNGFEMTEDKAWQALNGFEFKYGEDKRLKGGQNEFNSLAPSVSGFTTDYAMTSVAEDKAEVFACLMVSSQNKLIHRWAAQDRILRNKIQAMKAMVAQFCGELIL